MWVYREHEGKWLVGYYAPRTIDARVERSEWVTVKEFDPGDEDIAAMFVHWINGGDSKDMEDHLVRRNILSMGRVAS